MIHGDYTIINFNKNPKNHRPENKKAPTFNKKNHFSFSK
jgi:hypothetical protein